MTRFEVPFTPEAMGALLPYLVVAAGGLLVMLVDAFVRTLKKDHLSYLTLCVLIVTVVVQIAVVPPEGAILGGMLLAGSWARFFTFLFAGIGVMTTIFATGIFDRDARYRPEFYPLLLFNILGMMVLAAANDLIAVFLGLETMSLATYVLAGGVRGNVRSSEAGFKYLALGGFSSAFLLMGMALVYGYAGGTGFAAIRAAVVEGGGHGTLLLLG
ncbi:MAG TPA: proton-conducting transporter membrane subunit, partial [Candidatus Krumholzibacteria bacterium]|nr:proton-conducting transporter membrane subunit [Candidatus Krumholzibacteria bacterium]